MKGCDRDMAVTEKRKRATVATVAKAAGVSRAAVYAALNRQNPSNIGLSDATRRKIEQAIQEQGYIPNDNARSLVAGRSRSVGLLLTDSIGTFGGRLVNAFGEVFGTHRHRIIADSHYGDEEIERRKLESFFSQGVDAVILTQSNPAANRELLSRFLAAGAPVISMGCEACYDDYHYLCFDEERIMHLIAAHLGRVGAKQVAYMAPQNLFWSGEIRRQNLERAMRTLSADRQLLGGRVENYVVCRRTLEAWFSKAETSKPDAIVCYNDQLAATVIHCLNAIGVAVPQQVRVIGIDDIHDPFAPLPLTTVRLPLDALAEACWRCFAEYNRPEGFRGGLIAPELIERASSPSYAP